MVALPDFDREFSGPPLLGDEADTALTGHDNGLAGLALRLAGGGLIVAALGLWVVPSHTGDAAMMLVKLLFSVVLFWAGMLALHAARGPDRRPDIEIDARARELRLRLPQRDGTTTAEVHRFDDLHELSLRDGLLSARDRTGCLVVSIEVAGRRGERALQQALACAV